MKHRKEKSIEQRMEYRKYGKYGENLFENICSNKIL